MVTTRAARTSDADAIQRLTAQLGYDVEPSQLRARLSSLIARPDHLFIVACDGEPAVGWLHATVAEYIETGPFVVVGGLVVDSRRRGEGIGRLLLDEAEAWARQRGCSIVRLWSSVARAGAHRFYERAGYTNIKTQYSFVKCLDPAGEAGLRAFVPRVDEEPH